MLVITERAVTHSVAAETTFMQCSSDLGLRSTGLTCLCKVEHEAKKKKTTTQEAPYQATSH